MKRFPSIIEIIHFIISKIFDLLNPIKKLDSLISNCAVSLVGLFSVIFILKQPAGTHLLENINDISPIFLACGGLLGTMLALVVSISIIPIQQASENFTASIVQIYKEDRKTRLIFASLALLCLLSFLMVFGVDLGYSKSELLLIQIIVIAISLDLIRLHQRHVITLLGSNEAINKLKNRIIKFISLTQSNVRRVVKIQIFFLKKQDQQKVSSDALETLIYTKSNIKFTPVKIWIGELTEIAIKSITNGEVYRAELAIFAMAEVAVHYLNIRKNNMTLFVEEASFGVKGSDVDKILSPIYEHYKDINRVSIGHENETVSIYPSCIRHYS